MAALEEQEKGLEVQLRGQLLTLPNLPAARDLAKLEGFMCGISCGAAAWAAMDVDALVPPGAVLLGPGIDGSIKSLATSPSEALRLTYEGVAKRKGWFEKL